MQPIVKISENIYQVHVPIPFPLIRINRYLVRDFDGWAMIDTGLLHMLAFEASDAAFTSLSLEALGIRSIYLTHAHPDHYKLAGHFQRISSAPVYVRWNASGPHGCEWDKS